MVAYPKPQQMKKGESERLREERDKTKLIDLRFGRGQVDGFRKAKKKSSYNVQVSKTPIQIL